MCDFVLALQADFCRLSLQNCFVVTQRDNVLTKIGRRFGPMCCGFIDTEPNLRRFQAAWRSAHSKLPRVLMIFKKYFNYFLKKILVYPTSKLTVN